MSKPKNKPSSQNKKKLGAKQTTNPWLWIGIAAIILLVGVGAFILVKPNNDQATQGAPLPPEISVDQAYAKYQEGTFFLDVRTPEEWVEYHAPNSTLIPLDELETRLSEVPQDQEVVVVCRSGNRSQVGRDILLKAGHSQVTSMAGGLSTWRQAGYPVTSGP